MIHRDIFLNSIEPEYLAFRFAAGVDTLLALHFKKPDGSPFNEDVVAQLQMVGRSTGALQYLPCPATDVVNGAARAIIPLDTLYDPNGWQLRLTGTVNQEPAVLAYGVALAAAGAGIQVEPQEIIDTIDLTLVRGVDVLFTVKIWKDTDKTIPYDLATATISAPLLSAYGGPQIDAFTVSGVAVNVVTLTMPLARVNALPDLCWWNLTINTGSGLTTLAQGNVRVIVTP